MSRHEAGRQAGSILLRTIRSGTSGAEVFLLRQPGGATVATKATRSPRVSSSVQVQRHALMAKHFASHTPAVLGTATEAALDVIVTAAPAVWSLDEAIDRLGPTPELYAAWRDVVVALVTVWRSTARPGFDPGHATRNHDLRCRRGLQGLEDALTTDLESPSGWSSLVINGSDMCSWAGAFERLLGVGRPDFRVTCHGDPHAGNVLVASDGTWHLIDWEWSGDHHDWRMMVSHLLGSWYVRDLLDHASGTASATSDRLVLDYAIGETPRLRQFGIPAADAFRRMTTPARTEQDLGDVARYVALLLLREIPQAVLAGRRHLIAPLLGECIRLTTGEHSNHPAIRLLRAPVGAAM
ncbi:phosphotransferase family protein [Micromonospora sediminimaris]|uniref:phosphotransferase family protein n=1 Tax=Micromonospora sediminimaris TaxID=547162 RepID=UPI0037BA6100